MNLLQEAAKSLIPTRSPSRDAWSRIYIGALARPDMAACEFGKRVLPAIEPGDTETLSQLVEVLQEERSPRHLKRS